jgi:hypothetical protein
VLDKTRAVDVSIGAILYGDCNKAQHPKSQVRWPSINMEGRRDYKRNEINKKNLNEKKQAGRQRYRNGDDNKEDHHLRAVTISLVYLHVSLRSGSWSWV